MRERTWSACVAVCCVAGCFSERGVAEARHDEHAGGAAAQAAAADMKEAAPEVPLGAYAVTLEVPAVRARHVEGGDRVDLFVVRPPSSTNPHKEGDFVGGGLWVQDAPVTRSVCDDHECSLTLHMGSDEHVELRSLGADPRVEVHPWVRPPGARDVEGGYSNLRDVVSMHERLLARQSSRVSDPAGWEGEERRLIALEVDAKPRSLPLFGEGVTGEVVASFEAVDGGLTDGEAPSPPHWVTTSLMQRVRVERARAEGGRVVLELEVPVEQAMMFTLARSRAARVDFAPGHPDAPVRVEPHEEWTRSVLKGIEFGGFDHEPGAPGKPWNRKADETGMERTLRSIDGMEAPATVALDGPRVDAEPTEEVAP